MSGAVRRVVTGDSADGKAVVASETEIAPEPPRVGVVVHALWGSDTPVDLPADGADPDAAGITPPPGGFRFALVTFAPNEEVLGGGLHRSDTIDMGLVVSGSIFMELDDGVEVQLRQGDTLVQHGTIHAWHNRSSEPCTMAVAAVGARRTAT
ncbi:MAG: cupin domain-containing protein [Acidimicrobiia bacterium]